eukprot:scaffold18264_cov67-Phaeocystis_antarctica.AAC.2
MSSVCRHDALHKATWPFASATVWSRAKSRLCLVPMIASGLLEAISAPSSLARVSSCTRSGVTHDTSPHDSASAAPMARAVRASSLTSDAEPMTFGSLASVPTSAARPTSTW